MERAVQLRKETQTKKSHRIQLEDRGIYSSSTSMDYHHELQFLHINRIGLYMNALLWCVGCLYLDIRVRITTYSSI
jgi:hypothetical protein